MARACLQVLWSALGGVCTERSEQRKNKEWEVNKVVVVQGKFIFTISNLRDPRCTVSIPALTTHALVMLCICVHSVCVCWCQKQRKSLRNSAVSDTRMLSTEAPATPVTIYHSDMIIVSGWFMFKERLFWISVTAASCFVLFTRKIWILINFQLCHIKRQVKNSQI